MITYQSTENSISITEYLESLFQLATPADGAICFMGKKILEREISQNFLSVCDIQNSGIQLVHLMDQMSQQDLFVSFATYKGGPHVKRDTAHLANIYAWSVDVDYVNESISPDDYLSYIMENVSIPEPSFVEMGHRLRLVYVFSEPLRLCSPRQKKKLLSAFKFLQQCITRMINEELSFGGASFGAESNPPTSFFRLPGGINSKDGSIIRVMPYSEERYSLQEVFDEFVPNSMLDASRNKETWYAAWKRKTSIRKRKKSYTGVKDLWMRRLETLKHLRTLPGAHRKKLCFVYACGLIHAGLASSLEEILPLVMEFNEGFQRPLPYNKVYAHVKLVDKKPYKFTDAYLAKYLEVSPSYFAAIPKKEYDHMRWIHKKEKMEQKGITKTQKIHARLEALAALRDKGISLQEIAAGLGVSLSTIKRDMKLLKEKGILKDSIKEMASFARQIKRGAHQMAKKILGSRVQREEMESPARRNGMNLFALKEEYKNPCRPPLIIPNESPP